MWGKDMFGDLISGYCVSAPVIKKEQCNPATVISIENKSSIFDKSDVVLTGLIDVLEATRRIEGKLFGCKDATPIVKPERCTLEESMMNCIDLLGCIHDSLTHMYNRL
jgi:hypothetical protein